MSDAKIERLQRAATQGGPAERRPLLQALLRAKRPLGDAWPDGEVTIRLAERYQTEAALDVLAQIDMSRLRDGLASHGAAFLADLGDDDLRASLDGPQVLLRNYEFDYEYDKNTPRWSREGWRWRCDAPAYVRRLAASPNGQHAAATWAGESTIHRGSPGALAAGDPVSTWTAPDPLIGLGFSGGNPVAVTHEHLYVLRGDADPVPRALKLKATVAGFGPDGTVAVSDGRAVAILDPTTGRVLWKKADLRVETNSIEGLVPGPEFLAVCSGDVRLCSLSDGSGLTSCKRGTFTKVWEDPESTMGMGRDRHEYTAYDPSFVDAAWVDGVLVTVDATGGIEGWRVSPRGRRVSRAGKEPYRANPRAVASSSSGLAFTASTSTLHAMGARSWSAQLPAPAHAISTCGTEKVLVGLRNGRIEVFDACGERLRQSP